MFPSRVNYRNLASTNWTSIKPGLKSPARRSAILKLSGLYIQRGKSGFTTAKEAATKMDRRTRIRKKRSPAEETGVKYRRVNKIGHNTIEE